jgi:hypothetical protein
MKTDNKQFNLAQYRLHFKRPHGLYFSIQMYTDALLFDIVELQHTLDCVKTVKHTSLNSYKISTIIATCVNITSYKYVHAGRPVGRGVRET